MNDLFSMQKHRVSFFVCEDYIGAVCAGPFNCWASILFILKFQKLFYLAQRNK